jgi:dTDP-4-dehydrorhamnose reductase
LRILLTGRNGQVGWELERALPALGELIATDRSTLDLADADAIRRTVRKIQPELIVNAAAYTAVDRAESEPAIAARINADAPGVLAEEARRLRALLVHYSTDYVFDGAKPSAYTEQDSPNPLSSYGRSKLAGEAAIRKAGCRHLILRTSWVYGPRGRNFYRAIAAKAAAGERLRVVADQVGVPTSSRFLAEETVALLRQGAEQLLHLVPSGSATWHAFAQEIVGADVTVEPIATSEYPTPARRPANSVLDNRGAAAILGRPFAHWRALLDAVKATGID